MIVTLDQFIECNAMFCINELTSRQCCSYTRSSLLNTTIKIDTEEDAGEIRTILLLQSTWFCCTTVIKELLIELFTQELE